MKLYIMYDALFDIDFSMIKFLGNKMKNSTKIQRDIYKYTDNQMKHILLSRRNENPLSLIFWEYDDRLYDDVYEKYCQDIYRNITMSDIMKLVKVYSTMFNTNDITIVCRDIRDKSVISDRIKNTQLSVCNLMTEDKLDNCLEEDDYVIVNKGKTFINNHKNHLSGYNIWLWKTKYAVQYDGDLSSFVYREEINPLLDKCNVKLIEPYVFDKSYRL